jgi:hypothetical protein
MIKLKSNRGYKYIYFQRLYIVNDDHLEKKLRYSRSKDNLQLYHMKKPPRAIVNEVVKTDIAKSSICKYNIHLLH